AISGANSGDFAQTNGCGTSVAAGGSCRITVTFTPTATGTRSAALTVTDDAVGSPQTASLSGSGTTSAAVVSPSPFTFANSQAVGTTSALQSLTLTNTGSGIITFSSISATGDFYSPRHQLLPEPGRRRHLQHRGCFYPPGP